MQTFALGAVLAQGMGKVSIGDASREWFDLQKVALAVPCWQCECCALQVSPKLMQTTCRRPVYIPINFCCIYPISLLNCQPTPIYFFSPTSPTCLTALFSCFVHLFTYVIHFEVIRQCILIYQHLSLSSLSNLCSHSLCDPANLQHDPANLSTFLCLYLPVYILY